MAQIASARANPFAFSSKVLHDASGDKIPSEVKDAEMVGVSMMLVPATMADVASPFCIARQASCRPTSDAEHPVFTTELISH